MSDDGEEGKRDGMSRAARSADPHWWQCMLECGRIVAERKPYFIMDDIVGLCRVRFPNATTHEYRANGPLMGELARLGYCISTDDFAESRQKQCNKRPMRVWWSLIYRGRVEVKKPRKRKPLDPRQISLLIAEVNG